MRRTPRPTDKQIASWYPRLFRTALRISGSVEDASDLTQEAFCKALNKWDQFNGKSLPTSWLHRILVNCARDLARRNKVRRAEPLEPWALTAISARQGRFGDRLIAKEKLEHLRGEIERLPTSLRQVFVIVVLDGYTYREAADLLDVPAGTIGWQMNEARKRLYCAMRQRFPED